MWGHIYTYFWICELEKVLPSTGVPVHFPPNKSTQTKNMIILYQCVFKIGLINTSVASDLQKMCVEGPIGHPVLRGWLYLSSAFESTPIS